MTAKGHEDAFPRPTLSARCRFSQGTFAGTRGNGEYAPIPAVLGTAMEPRKSTQSRHPLRATTSAAAIDGATDPFSAWATVREAALAPAEAIAAELYTASAPDLVMLVVAGRQLRQALG